MGKHVFTVRKEKTYLDKREVRVKGLRCSNALLSDQTTKELIANLDDFASYEVNTISVYFMGSRFSDINGFNEDGTLDPVYANRMANIIEAADARGMIVLVGCLYWGEVRSRAKDWIQKEANSAVKNTVQWLKDNDYRNVFIDVDNEGMARRNKGFSNKDLVLSGKSVDPSYIIATNYVGAPPEEANLGIHFADKPFNKPYIETEGVPENAPGGYWHCYSKKPDPSNRYRLGCEYKNYINVGIYTEDMKSNQKSITRKHLSQNKGYLMASTWLQAAPPKGPNYTPGGDGSRDNPGIKWWLEFLKELKF